MPAAFCFFKRLSQNWNNLSFCHLGCQFHVGKFNLIMTNCKFVIGSAVKDLEYTSWCTRDSSLRRMTLLFDRQFSFWDSPLPKGKLCVACSPEISVAKVSNDTWAIYPCLENPCPSYASCRLGMDWNDDNKKRNQVKSSEETTWFLLERKTGLKPATLSLEG